VGCASKTPIGIEGCSSNPLTVIFSMRVGSKKGIVWGCGIHVLQFDLKHQKKKALICESNA